ncbi:MAG: LacI family transcriptional regulator [Acidobacteria bacterium]|nr:LacI family transcriptional regulator [Acidobacteriota bacterium]
MNQDLITRAARPTIQDVARLAGVSVATVSAVMNGTVRVSPERTERVQRAMAALQYRPDERGRTLRTGHTRLIGVVVPDVTNPFYPEILREIEHAARQRGYSVLLCDSANDPEQERGHLEALVGRGVDGALVACTDSATSYEWLESRAFPAVFFERIPVVGRITAVSTDHEDAALAATRHLLNCGHRQIAFLATNPSLSSVAGRVEGFRKALAEAGLPLRQEFLRTQIHGADEARAAALELLRAQRKPTAFLCSNSVLLLGVDGAVRGAGLECPRDVSLMCFDSPLWTHHHDPPITTMSQPTMEIASEAVRCLLERIKNKSAAARARSVTWLKDTLVVRQSTGPAPRKTAAKPA